MKWVQSVIFGQLILANGSGNTWFDGPYTRQVKTDPIDGALS